MPAEDYGLFWFRATSRFQELAAGATTILTLNSNGAQVELWGLKLSCSVAARAAVQILNPDGLGGAGTVVTPIPMDRASDDDPTALVLAGSATDLITVAGGTLLVPVQLAANIELATLPRDRPLLILDTSDVVAITITPVVALAGAVAAATLEWQEPGLSV